MDKLVLNFQFLAMNTKINYTIRTKKLIENIRDIMFNIPMNFKRL